MLLTALQGGARVAHKITKGQSRVAPEATDAQKASVLLNPSRLYQVYPGPGVHNVAAGLTFAAFGTFEYPAPQHVRACACGMSDHTQTSSHACPCAPPEWGDRRRSIHPPTT